MGSKQICSVCSAPPKVRNVIETELHKPAGERMKLRDLEKLAGFSRSAISRHSRRCISRGTLAAFNATRFDHGRDAIFVQWPGQRPGLQSLPENFHGAIPAEPRPNDVVLTIKFEAPVAPVAVEPPPPIPAEEIPAPPEPGNQPA